MKQHGDDHWHGHRDITREAVRRLYATMAGPDGRIRGLDEQRYFETLDKAQAYMDRPLGAGLVRNFNGTKFTVPYVGLGPTAHSAYANPGAQREHFMADPYKYGADNLAINVGYLNDAMTAARQAGVAASGPDDIVDREMPPLGAAVHALQDSYSGAHAWREDSVYDGNVDAPIQSLHVFTPLHAVGIDDGKNTHSDEFDKPPVNSGSARAATEATYRLLRVHEEGHRTSPGQAQAELWKTLGPMVAPSASGVTVNTSPNAEWAAERDRRVALEHAPPKLQPTAESPTPVQAAEQAGGKTLSADELRVLGDVLSTQPNSPLAPTSPDQTPAARPGPHPGGRSPEGLTRD